VKTIPSLKRHHYLKRVGILLIAAALIAGIVSCNGGAVQYDLTITSTAGGVVTDPGEGTHSYAARKVVDLVATPDCGYAFDKWSGDTGTIDDVNAGATNITMSASYNITANFKPIPPDHYKFYEVDEKTAPYVGTEVQMEDQFGTFTANVTYAVTFGNPVEKEHPGMPLAPISDENRHYTLYELDFGEGPEYQVTRSVEVSNQFQNEVELTVQGPVALAVPTKKEGHEMVDCLNHYLVYVVDEGDYGEFEPVEGVNLKDQFIPNGEDVTVKGPYLFANPVKKTVVGGVVSEIEDPDLHWVLYDIGGDVPSIGKTIQIANQFGNQTLDLTYRDTLAVPSEKISWEKPLSHFHFYWSSWADEPPMYGQTVLLEDQFILDWLHEPLSATVEEQVLFANPTEKMHGESWTPISDWKDHLTCYNLSYEEQAPVYYVEISNQFDPLEQPGYQQFYVQGPEMLAVPTQKFPHDPPGDLDHYTLYRVLGEPPVLYEPIWVSDQFTSYSAEVYPAAYLAVPVKKTLGSFTAPIKNPNDHLMLYWMDGGEFSKEWLPINNQFGPQFLKVWQDEYEFLGVPSQKLFFSIAD